jgi:hypothetical protein
MILFYNILGVYTSSIKEIGGRNCESLFLTKNYKNPPLKDQGISYQIWNRYYGKNSIDMEI